MNLRVTNIESKNKRRAKRLEKLIGKVYTNHRSIESQIENGDLVFVVDTETATLGVVGKGKKTEKEQLTLGKWTHKVTSRGQRKEL